MIRGTNRVLNRHKRGRPRHKFFQRLKSRAVKLVIPLAVFGVIGLIIFALTQLGLL